MAHKHSQCVAIRERIERAAAAGGTMEGVAMEGDVVLERHLSACAACREYAGLRTWSRQVLLAGEISAEPPRMSAVWASIHRASEQAWDRALARSFRNLIPYMVAVVAIILLVGGLSTQPPAAAAPADAVNTAFSELSSPRVPAVAGVMTTASLPLQDPAELIGGQR